MDLIATMLDYIENYIEKPYAAFGDFPICPFAKKARLAGKIKCIVTTLTISTTESLLESFVLQEDQDEVMILLDATISKEDFFVFFQEFKEIAEPLGVVVFEGHPESDFQMNGIYTRRDPVPNVQLIKRKFLEDAQKKLSISYYKN